ncbi:unnamed protein product [Pedinophyceae sp. YPF-701]|nr:unnamed protein product [Pedinophyceae sp. YPF-701]
MAPFERDTFSAVDYVNRLFPTTDSLTGLDGTIAALRRRIGALDAEILAAVRSHPPGAQRTHEGVAAVEGAIRDMTEHIAGVRTRAEAAQKSVQSICSGIRRLDLAKRHLTSSITVLRRLGMLVGAVDRLEGVASTRQYGEAARLMSAATDLMAHFEPYVAVPRVAEVSARFERLRESMRQRATQEFHDLLPSGSAGAGAEGGVAPAAAGVLSEACQVINAIGGGARDDLVAQVCSRETTAFSAIFATTGPTGKLEKVEGRLSFVRKAVTGRPDVWEIFPREWRVQELLAMTLCKLVRAQLAEILDAAAPQGLDVTALLQGLQKTIEFEEGMQARFGSSEGGGGREAAGTDALGQVKAKWERVREERRRERASLEAGGAGDDEGEEREAGAGGVEFNFRGAISGVFEKHMGSYVELEERALREAVDKLLLEETWQMVGGASGPSVLQSSTQVFMHIKRSLKRGSSLSRGAALLLLYQAFQRGLVAYAGKLAARLPRTASGQPAAKAAAGDKSWHVPLSEHEELVVVLIVNTAGYCHDTCQGLAESVAKLLEDEDLRAGVDPSGEQDEFHALKSRALQALVLGVDTRLEQHLHAMSRVAWSSVDMVGDASAHVAGIQKELAAAAPRLGRLLDATHFGYFCDKLVASLVPRYQEYLYRCQRVSDAGAQQLLLDSQVVRATLLELPTLGGHAASPSFGRYVAREMGRVEAFIKVVLSPPEALVDTFAELLPGASATDFRRVLEVKSLSRQEQQQLVEAYEKQSGTAVPLAQQPQASAATGFAARMRLASGPATAPRTSESETTQPVGFMSKLVGHRRTGSTGAALASKDGTPQRGSKATENLRRFFANAGQLSFRAGQSEQGPGPAGGSGAGTCPAQL